MGIWPSNLIEELAYRRGIIFFGSGISATAKRVDGTRPATWKEFMESIRSIAKNLTDADNAYLDEKMKCQDYLATLQAIYEKCDPGEYSKFLRDTYGRGGLTPSIAHEKIKEIDCKIVITTNFDKIYDTFCSGEGYTTLTYDEPKAIVNNIKSPNNLIIKAHGTIDKIDHIIFTEQQYYSKQEEYPEFYAILSALFLTNTVVFLGYSLNDPDINLVLQFLHKTASPLAPHYLVMKSGVPEQQKRFWKNTYNVQIIEYGDEYDQLLGALEELSDSVQELREARSIS
ncbi:MAG: SIR2 family protein [Lachnospiraceae bacterium]|nr:SIR2 family protein [Lachnospiraceae bacterium]